MKLRHVIFSDDRPESFPSPDFGPSLTKQSFSNESDINYVVSQYLRTGSGPLSLPLASPPQFFDASTVPDYQTSLNFVRDSRARFDALSDSIRSRFASPEAFVAFMADPQNLPEMISLGIVQVKPLRATEPAPGPEGAAGGKGAQPPSPGPSGPPTAPSKGA